MAERENLPVPENPDFNLQIGGLQPDDPVHFAQMNNMLAQLLTNDAFLERLANKMIEKALVAHVLDSSNSSMVLGADQAPALTALIDAERERITQLNSDIMQFHEVTLPAAAWEGSAAPYAQTVSIPGMTVDDNPILVSLLPDNASSESQTAYNTAYSVIASGTGTTGDGTVTFKAYQKPAIDITIGLKGV